MSAVEDLIVRRAELTRATKADHQCRKMALTGGLQLPPGFGLS